MKKVLIVIACAFFSFSFSSVKAQSNKEDVDLIQAAFGKDKKDLVSQYMMVSAKDSAAFWKLYDEYETKRKALGKERINIIQSYADNYNNLTNAKATELGNAVIKSDENYTKLQKEYFDKFGKVVGGKNSLKLFQLELYLQNMVRVKVMNSIPFIDELDKSKMSGQ
jgi:hypothetical protein